MENTTPQQPVDLSPEKASGVNKFLMLSLALVVLVLVGFGGYTMGLRSAGQRDAVVDQPPVDQDSSCTLEAKQCPDGTFVGRTGPNCEFECPTTITPHTPPEIPADLLPIDEINEGIACTMDAMECPDGTYVGRTGPNCEFECPTAE